MEVHLIASLLEGRTDPKAGCGCTCHLLRVASLTPARWLTAEDSESHPQSPVALVLVDEHQHDVMTAARALSARTSS